jgi:FkbM family methyltransferase
VIRANFAHYGATGAELVPLALSDQVGEASFHVSSGKPRDEFSGPDWNYGNKSSSLLAPATAAPMHGWIEFKEIVQVRTATLDTFCRERAIDRIDFIHMDVQGAEHLVLQGAADMLPHVTALWLEVSEQALYRGQKLRPEIEGILHAHGFRLGLEVRREIEGDQFYVNLRQARAWRYLAALRLRAFAGRIKRRLAR